MTRVRQSALPCLALLAMSGALACSEHRLATCDITQRACQEDIYYRLLSLRNDGYDPFGGLPPVSVISEGQYRRQLEQEAAAAAQSGPSPWDKALELLHFTTIANGPADGGAGVDGGTGNSTIDDQATHVYAFYDPTVKTVTIVDHPGQANGDNQQQAMITLAHELVHSLQDREIDLDKQDFPSSDDYFAFDSMIEGDARFYEYLFENGLLRLGYPQTAMVKMPDYELDYIYTHIEQAGAPLFAAKLLLYPLGAKYLATAYDSGGNAAVRHAYAKAPSRTVGLLVGGDGRVPPVGTGEACPAPVALALDPTSKTASADRFGALPFYTFLRGWGLAHDVAFATAQTWTGDFLRVQASSDFATSAAAWRVEFSTTPPNSIAQALATTGELTVTSSANALLITTSDAATPLVWTASASCP
jgi:hypothetical protein